MKSNFVVSLIFVVAVCNAAKFPIHWSHQGDSDEEAEVPVFEEIVPVTANTLGNEFGEDCDFCNDFMLGDCNCYDVNFCKSKHCYVPEKCKCDSDEEAEVPVFEEIVPVTANTLGNDSGEDCDFCNDFMLGDCNCYDVNFCKSKHCYVPEKCKCDSDEEAEVPEFEEIVPVTANTLGNESGEECQFCERMLYCFCDDVDWCRKQQCSVDPSCDNECP